MQEMETRIRELAGEAAGRLMRRGQLLATAESCTGGMIAAFLTEVPGVSAIYPGGFVTYSAAQKAAMLGISPSDLSAWGIVSAKTASAMARGAAGATGADAALSVTGNAGPTAQDGKPVGLVYIGCVCGDKERVKECQFDGTRREIRLKAVQEAFLLLMACMEEES